MHQVIMNLVINGAEVIQEGAGSVTVKTGVREFTAEELRLAHVGAGGSGRHVWLMVKDSGVGMDEPTRGKIFDPFFTTKF
jgi:two-component system cell cycle sensor histidine kinase/response regulator CckA